jgi:predicted lipid-binding transport protein (Tim44 family)
MSPAEAKRFGGGKSFGMQRTSASYTKPSSTASNILKSPTATPKRNWLGALAGLAAGGLLAYLFFGHGLGTSLFTWLIIAGIVYFIWTRIRPQAPLQNFANNANQVSTLTPNSTSAFTPMPAANDSNPAPADFDTESFIRNAKVLFIRLQAAYDTKNIADLRDFTAPEVFGEIQMQLQERGDALNRTEVLSLNAEILDVTNDDRTLIVTTRFTGSIKEEDNAPELITETWHFEKNHVDDKWLVAGIEQN